MDSPSFSYFLLALLPCLEFLFFSHPCVETPLILQGLIKYHLFHKVFVFICVKSLLPFIPPLALCIRDTPDLALYGLKAPRELWLLAGRKCVSWAQHLPDGQCSVLFVEFR